MSAVDGPGAPSSVNDLVRIRPTRRWNDIGWAELWQHRELIYFMVWRDLKVRYRQTVLGLAWAVLNPVLNTVVFSVIFGALAGLPSDGVPYPVFTFCAMLPWQLFLRGLNNASQSVIANQNLITKIYFPRMIIPLSAVLSGVVDFLIGLGVLAVLMALYRVTPTWAVLLLPLFCLVALVSALAAGLWMAALSVQYRDVQQILPFLSQLWFYATPIAYATSIIPVWLRPVYGLNPMVGVVNAFRWALLGLEQPPDLTVWISMVMVLLLLITGVVYFRRVEDTFADHV